MYAGEEYQQATATAIQQLDRLGAQRLSPARWQSLVALFEQATRLEVSFWQMGLDQSM